MTFRHKLHFCRVPLGIAVALLVLLGSAGCQAPRYTDYDAFIREPQPVASSVPYRMGPPDMILVESYRVREINGHKETISPEGNLHLPLLGPIQVAGRTVAEVREELIARAQHYYEDADVNVQVVRYASKRFFVFGQVASPGQYFFDGSNTVLNTLAQARPTDLANPSRIMVLRPNADGEMTARMTIDLDRMVREGDTSLNAFLQDGDILYVPPTGVAKVALALRQVLLPLQPIAETVQAPADISRSATGQAPYGSE